MKHFLTFVVLAITVCTTLFLVGACSSSDTDEDTDPAEPYWNWFNIGPTGGYISSVVFHPTRSGEVWASGDDSDGLYKSENYGASWTLVEGIPVNQSTFSFIIDPSQPNSFYVPSHYGRGMLISTDGGVTWTLSQANLPSTTEMKRIYGLAIHPKNSDMLFAATDDGLYRSLDSGVRFTKLSVAWGTVFRTVSFDADGRLFVGSSDGTLKFSPDNGVSWNDIFTGSGVGVDKLAMTSNALYISYLSGDLLYILLPTMSEGGMLNSSSTEITTGLYTSLAVISGTSQASDTIYFGTSRKIGVSSDRWGLFKSTNGGASFIQAGGEFSGSSVFSIAIDPANSNNVVVGTMGEGIFHSRDAGLTYISSNATVYANSGLAFAQDPSDPDHLLFSSSIGSGFGYSYESYDRGESWSVFSHVNSNDGESAFDIDPSNAQVVLAGTFASGVYRSIGGVLGTWTRVLDKDVFIDRFIRDIVNRDNVYALAVGPNPGANPDVTLYYSANGGDSFEARLDTFANDLAPHPSRSGEAVIAGIGDAYATTDFFITKTGLGLSPLSADEGGIFSAVAFDPQNPNVILIGGAKGGVYQTTNYHSSGNGITWRKLNTPIQDAVIRDIHIVVRDGVSNYYVATTGADVNFSPSTTAGLFRSSDQGQTWVELSEDGLEPCTIFWRFQPDVRSSNIFLGGMWGGGLAELVETP